MPFELILDRVFGGDDLGFVALDFQQRAVERGALAGAGRAGHQDDAVRQADQFAEGGVKVVLHAELAERELHRALVQQTQHDAFAVDHGDHGNADIDLAAADPQLDAAVLRQAALGDVQPGHDLQAADDGRLKAIDFRRHRLGVQHAVDAVAHRACPTAAIRCARRWPAARSPPPGFRSPAARPTALGPASESSASSLPSSQIDTFVVAALGQQAVDRFAADAQVRLDPLGDFLAAGQHRHDRQPGGRHSVRPADRD